MKTSLEYTREVANLSSQTDFEQIDTLINTMSANFCWKNTELALLTAEKAIFIGKDQLETDEKGKKPSVASSLVNWNMSKEGIERTKLKAEIENMKLLIKAVENQAFSIRSESRLTANS